MTSYIHSLLPQDDALERYHWGRRERREVIEQRAIKKFLKKAPGDRATNTPLLTLLHTLPSEPPRSL